jgi:hypothetical protein
VGGKAISRKGERESESKKKRKKKDDVNLLHGLAFKIFY